MEDTPARIEEYQRNVGFIAFVLVVTFAAFVYLTEQLASVVAPLIWAAFFALPLTALITLINDGVVYVFNWMAWLVRGDNAHKSRIPVSFRAKARENRIHLDKTPESTALLERLEQPCLGLCFLLDPVSCCGLDRYLASFFQPRVRIVELNAAVDETEVNRLVVHWSYYTLIQEAEKGAEPLASASGFTMDLYLDSANKYPAAVGSSDLSEGGEVSGKLELETSSWISWFLSVCIAMFIMLVGVWFFFECITQGVKALKQNTAAYETGVREFLISVTKIAQRFVPEDTWKDMQAQAQDGASSSLPALASDIASRLQSIGFEMVLFVIYIGFWIFEPLPVNDSVAQVVKSYLLLKTLVCLLFAGLMSMVLHALHCHLWSLFFVITFLLNYIPEVGPMLTALLMVPAILFDGNIELEQRKSNTITLMCSFVLFKLMCANIIEVKLYSSQGGEYMRMHPVVLMATMMLCSCLLGISGMFLAIPIVAAIKYYAVSGSMPHTFLHPFLICFEGDESAPHKNFIDRRRVGYGSTEEKHKTKGISHDGPCAAA